MTHGPDASTADTMYPDPGQWLPKLVMFIERVAEGSTVAVVCR